jgi:hypothetical protein
MSRNTYRIVAAFVLACLMTASAHALPLSLDSRQPAGFAAIWEWIASRLSGLTAIWQQEGSGTDPNGSTIDAGCQMDPDGRPRDAGCQMDPNG